MSGSSITPKVHPITGIRLEPILFTGKDGKVREIWPILGAEDNGQPGTGGSGGTGDGGSGSTGTGGTGGGSTDDGGTGSGDGTGSGSTGTQETDPEKLKAMVKEANDQAARERHAKKEAERVAAEHAAKLKAIEDKDKTELERAQGDLKEAQTKLEASEQTIRELRIQNAFLASNKHPWQNPDAARRLADLSDVKIDDDGKVTGLEKALDKLAKDHPYLLKPQGNGTQGGTNGSSGTPAGSTGNGQPAKDSREAIARRFPAASRRR